MNREPNGQLSPSGIMNKPLGDHTDDIADEVGLMLMDYFPSEQAVDYAKYDASSLTALRIREWVDRSYEFIERYPRNQFIPKLRVRWHHVIDRYTG